LKNVGSTAYDIVLARTWTHEKNEAVARGGTTWVD
jgi:hypothetical protein